MSLIVVPLVILAIVGPRPEPPPARLADFTRVATAVGADVVVVETDGLVREGRLVAADADSATLRFAAATRQIPRTAIASADRRRDGWKDGLIKGALLGLAVGVGFSQAYEDGGPRYHAIASSVAFYGAAGAALDAAQSHREPLYRAPTGAPPPAAKPKWSFRLRW